MKQQALIIVLATLIGVCLVGCVVITAFRQEQLEPVVISILQKPVESNLGGLEIKDEGYEAKGGTTVFKFKD